MSDFEYDMEQMRRISELEDENEKLREERDMYRDLVGMMDHPDLNVQLQAENDKLRELLDYMKPIAWYAASENERDRMRELGVEV